MILSFAERLLWITSFVSCVCLSFALIYRKHWRRFPFWTTYFIFQSCSSIAFFALFACASLHLYAICYWGKAVIDYILQLGLLADISVNTLCANGRWIRGARKFFLRWGLLWAVVSIGSALSVHVPNADKWGIWENRQTVFMAVFSIGLFATMSAQANRLKLPRRGYVLSIGFAMSTWLIADAVLTVSYLFNGWSRWNGFLAFKEWTWILGTLYLAYVFWLPEKNRDRVIREEALCALATEQKYDLDRIREGSE